MEWDHEIDLSRRKFTSKLIVERAIARNWRICGFKTNPAVFLIYVPGRITPIKIFSASPSQMSYPASKIAKDKYITTQILHSNQLPTPKELLITDTIDIKTDISAYRPFLDENSPVVVKPIDASHGKGITVNVSTEEQLTTALHEALESSLNKTALIQEQIPGVDIRVVCINYTFVDAISRIPASVTGDGQHTLRQLIEITNTSDDRGENYKAKLNIIPLDKVQNYLGTEALATIPEAGKEVQVIGVSNVGMGGVRKNIKHDIPEFLKEIACKAAKILELPVCGVDFMVTHLPSIDDTLDSLDPRIIEVNECPMLTMYDDLNGDAQNEVIDTYLDYVASIDSK